MFVMSVICFVPLNNRRHEGFSAILKPESKLLYGIKFNFSEVEGRGFLAIWKLINIKGTYSLVV